jgi:predicted amidohydrolase
MTLTWESRETVGGLILLMLSGAIGCGQPQATTPLAGEEPATVARADRVRIAGIVLKWITADRQRNFERVVPLVREAARQGAQIVITTECFLDGYAIRDKSIPLESWYELGEEIPGGSYFERLCSLAAECRIYLVAGMLERVGSTTHNTAVLIGPDGKLIGRYRKHDLEHELFRNTPGTEYPVFDTPFGKIGLMICADRRNQGLVRRLAANGAEIVLCPSGGMWGPVRNDHFLQARSRENGVPIVFVHPIEFLVTGSDGEVLDVRLVGDVMDVEQGRIDSPQDSRQVAIFDLTIPVKGSPGGSP